MGIEAALIALLSSGVIEKGILVWIVMEFKSQNNAIARLTDKLDDVEAELADAKERFRDIRHYLGMKRKTDTPNQDTTTKSDK